MADAVRDARIQLTAADSATGFVDLSGAAAGTADAEILIQGTASVGQYLTSTLDGLLYDAGAAQNWQDNVFYIWINCGIVGLLDTKALGGFRIRFTGATVTDWFEVYVAGSDSWPAALQGGWTQFVVDIDEARSVAVTNGWTNGTVPATSAIQRVGWAGVTGGTMPRMVDNTWVDEIRRLPRTSPGITVDGRNGGTTPWTSANIASTLGTSTGTFVTSTGGAYKINTPIRFGNADTVIHEFNDTNVLWLWDNQEFLRDSFYKLSAQVNSGGSCNVELGIKTGTGEDATGAQGAIIQAASTGARWDMDFSDANINIAGFYGSSFIHGANLILTGPTTEIISSQYIDCKYANVDSTSNFPQIQNSIITPAVTDGIAFMETSNITKIVETTFESSPTGHAIELTANGTFTSKNFFSSYGADDTGNAALLYSSADNTTINVPSGYDAPTVDDSLGGTGTVTLVVAPVTTTVNVDDNTGSPLENARVYLEAADGTGDLPFQESVSISVTSSVATVTHTAHGLDTGNQVEIKGASDTLVNGAKTITVVDANSYTFPVTTTDGAVGGSIVSTGILINKLTNASGVADDTRSISLAQPVTGWVRSASGSPYFKTFPLSGTVSASSGLIINVQMILDE